MLEFLDAGADVLALRIGGTITSAELEQVLDRLEPMLAAHDKTHVYVEVTPLEGMSIAGLASYSARAFPLFARLARFGRVAVVAGQAWVRAATRIESTILPFISYRVFTPEQRAEALAWVEGRAATA